MTEKPLRVLHIVPSLDPDSGGPARSVPALCAALHALGIHVTLCTFDHIQERLPTDQPFPIIRFSSWPGTRQVPTLSYYKQMGKTAQGFDLVHLHSLWNVSVSLSSSVCRKLSTPYVITPRGMMQGGATNRKRLAKWLYFQLIERKTIRNAACFHFLTQEEARQSQRYLPASMPTCVVPNGIEITSLDKTKRNAFKQTFPGLRDKRIALYLGRLHETKGLALQMAAFERLAKDFSDLVWVLVGPDQGERVRISAWAQEQRLGDRVVFTGLLPHERSMEALADADVLLFSSIAGHEGQPMAVTEALGLGVPIVMTESVGVPELGKARSAVVVPSSIDAFANAIAQLLRNPDEAFTLRQTARQYAREHLAWPKVAEAMIQVYDGVLQRQPAPRAVARGKIS